MRLIRRKILKRKEISYFYEIRQNQRRQWQPTPVLLPGKSHGWRSLVGCNPWGREESDTTEQLHFSLSCTGEGSGNPVFLPGESQGRGSLVGCHLWGRAELDTTEATQQQQQQQIEYSLNMRETRQGCGKMEVMTRQRRGELRYSFVKIMGTEIF